MQVSELCGARSLDQDGLSTARGGSASTPMRMSWPHSTSDAIAHALADQGRARADDATVETGRDRAAGLRADADDQDQRAVGTG